MVTKNVAMMMKAAITVAAVSGTVLLFTGLLIPKEIQAQNATDSGKNMTTMNNTNNMTAVSNSSPLKENSTDLGTFTAAGPIAGVILPSTSAPAGPQTTGGNMTSSTITNSTTISSILPAKAFILSGAWHLKAENGTITFFDARFTKVHLDASNRHTHEIYNFHPASNNTSILLNPNGLTTIAGTVDIKLNGAPTWTNAKMVIIIDKLSTIAITLDPKDTSNHFLGQSVYGTVSMLKGKDRNDIAAFPRP